MNCDNTELVNWMPIAVRAARQVMETLKYVDRAFTAATIYAKYA